MKLYEAKKIITDVFESSFNKEKFSYFIRNLLKNLQNAEFLRKGYNIPKAFDNFIASYERLGKYEDEEKNLIDVLIVKLKREHSIDYARSSQRNFVRWYLNDKGKDAALVAFHTEKSTEWRFSFIKMQYSLETKKDELTPAKRSSFMVGEAGKSHTAQRQLIDLLKNDNAPFLSDIEKAFCIEAVSDEFYEKYKALLFNFVDEIESIVSKNLKVKNEFDSKKINILNFSKKLLGQIVFLYFLQKKGWLGLDKGDMYGDGDKSFLRSLFNKTKKGENFFNNYLIYLFYDALSKKRVTDYYERFKTRIPFLNGGLFDPIAFYDWEKTDIEIPNEIFSNRKDDEEGNGILDVFDLYNFTVKEDEPLETEVAIDPEMLGKVFERMLDVSERKSKGAFYTPREIVHYMAQQSLLYYLETELNQAVSYNKLGNGQSKLFGNEVKKGQLDLITENKDCIVPKSELETFIHYGEHIIDKDIAVVEGKLKEISKNRQIPESIRNNADAIDKALENIKICDPAVGSGAFPVGIMNEIVKLRKLLTPFLKNVESNRRSAYNFKSNAIQNSIYGVDIDEGAVEIAKLRLWLSMVVDENSIDAIEPLPNLEYKIVKGNSLINIPDGTAINSALADEIEKLTSAYYHITDKEQKQEQKQIIDNKIQEQLEFVSEFAGYNIDFDFKLLFHEVFNEKKGFDVVIGNPPYIAGKSGIITKELKKIYNSLYETAEYQLDTYILFIEKGHKILKKNGVFNYIIPNPWLANHRLIKIRQFLISQTKINEIVLLLAEIFKNATVDTLLLTTSKIISTDNRIEIIEYKNNHFNHKHLIKQNSLKKNKKFVFDINLNESHRSKIKTIKRNTIPIKDISYINRGVHAYRVDGYGKTKFGAGYQTQQDYDEKSYHADKKIDKTYFPEIRGKNIQPYYYKTDGLFISYGDWLAEPREWNYFTGERIYLRKIVGKTLFCAYIKEKNIADQSVYISKLNSTDFLTKYVLAILNSKLIAWYFRICNNEFDDLFPQIKVTEFKEIPIKKLDKILQKNISRVVDYILFQKSQSTDKTSIYFEQIIDGMVYELYFEDEIKQAGCDILKYLNNLPEINDKMKDNEKIKIINKVFNKLYDKESPVRKNLKAMEEVEEVAIIKKSFEK